MAGELIAGILSMGHESVEQEDFVKQVDDIEPLFFTRLGEVNNGKNPAIHEFAVVPEFPEAF